MSDLLAQRDAIQADCIALARTLKQFPRGPTGLTPDDAKTPAWRQARADYARAFEQLRAINGTLKKMGVIR